jgi:hypothetical protein
MNHMAQRYIQVANMALRLMQSPEIESFDEDRATARTVKISCYNVLWNCLEMYDWTFGSREEQMQEFAHCPLPWYTHMYKSPVDLLSI